jgi:hypothetical protein
MMEKINVEGIDVQITYHKEYLGYMYSTSCKRYSRVFKDKIKIPPESVEDRLNYHCLTQEIKFIKEKYG